MKTIDQIAQFFNDSESFKGSVKQNERIEKQREKKRAERREQAEQLQEQIAEKASGNVQIPGEGEEKQITVAGVEVKTKSASTYNTRKFWI